ncbi:MAG: hypothetical protein JWN96_4339 [Mycobacterium sp.]|nr:hypothetical protein [Mycobacterium sp.]
MISGEYRDFFIAVAGATGALIGLLFVAVTIAPERALQEETRLDFRSRASSALILFTNALTLSLVALVPGVTIGWWAIAFAVGVIAFAAATARLILEAGLRGSERWRSMTLVVALIGIAGVEAYGGIEQVRDSNGTNGLTTLDYVLVAMLVVGIARAWQLVGLRDTGLISSLRTLAGRGDEPGG